MSDENTGIIQPWPRKPGASSEAGLLDAVGFKTTESLLDPDNLRSMTPSPSVGASPYYSGAPSSSMQPRTFTWRSRFLQKWDRFWIKNKSLVLVAIAQLFGSVMDVMARLLETDGEGMHPFQILFARQSITAVACILYMYWAGISPLGPVEVRWLLVARGFTGFFGIYGMWSSIMYLPLAEATVISFLAPCLAGYLCHLILKDAFTRQQQIGSFAALVGVVLIARPASLFHAWTDQSTHQSAGRAESAEGPTDAQRAGAIGWALAGVLGAAGAFTTIRWIGKRAHPLVSVNYFSSWCTLVSTAVLLSAPTLAIGQPSLHFALPSGFKQWLLLVSLGLAGFVLQFLLTAGLAAEKSNRATAMVYTKMLFAASFDRWIFGNEMGAVSIMGCGLILSSVLWIALSQQDGQKEPAGPDIELGNARIPEAVAMLRPDERELVWDEHNQEQLR